MKPFLPLLWLLMLMTAVGCASLPQQRPLAPDEETRARSSFRELARSQKECANWLDAEARASFDSTWGAGGLPGYLQLQAPDFLRFVGVNPLGQPLLILNINGRNFSSVLPAEKKVYEGPVTAAAFQRYVPAGLSAEATYYWVIGRLRPGPVRLQELTGAQGSPDFWAKYSHQQGEVEELVRVNPEDNLVRSHLLLDKDGKIVLEVGYDDYSAGPCPLPGHLTIRGEGSGGTLELLLSDWQTNAPIADADLEMHLPPGFNRIEIQ